MKKTIWLFAVIFLCDTGMLSASPFLSLKKACEKGKMASCYRLGEMFLTGNEVRYDYAEAISYFEKVCHNGYLKGCVELGDMYERELGVEKNMQKAKAYYTKACEGGEGKGCIYLGKIEEHKKNYRKAKVFYNKACQQKHAVGCHELAVMYSVGRGLIKDPDNAVHYYQKACKYNKVFCADMGEIYEKGKFGIGINEKLSYIYYRKSCEEDNAWGCYKTGNIYYYGKIVKRDFKKAASLYQKACRTGGYGASKGCNNLAVLYSQGKGVPKNKKMAKKYYKKACDMGYFDACKK